MTATIAPRQRKAKVRILRGGLDPRPIEHLQVDPRALLRLALAEAILRACSPYWAWVLVARSGGAKTECDYPPECDHDRDRSFTGMRTCRRCKRPTPPQCIGSSGHCDDCRLASMSDFRLRHLPKGASVVGLRGGRADHLDI